MISNRFLKTITNKTGCNATAFLLLRASFCQTANGDGRIVNLVASSLRIDRVIATTFGIGRRKAEYNLLKGLVKLNGQTVVKKSIEVEEGDKIDQFSLDKTTETVYCFDRIQLLEIGGEKTKKGNLNLTLYKRKNVFIDKDDYQTEFDD